MSYMPARSEISDGDTVVGGPAMNHSSKPKGDSIKETTETIPHGTIVHGLTANADYFSEDRPYLVKIGEGNLPVALQKLDGQLKKTKEGKLLSKKTPTDWIGREVNPGEIGLINHGGLPSILLQPGRYPGFPFANWWARSWAGTRNLSSSVITFKGLTIVQVSQNQAAVVSDPQNRIFVVKNAGFVAYGISGNYDVLAVVDQTHLSTPVRDHITKVTLGHVHEVKMTSDKQEFVVAIFLDIPANNCAILQRGDDLELLQAGQHCVTNSNVTLRGMYTLGENQFEMPTKDIYTRDQVPVSLTLYLKWQLTEPLKLATHGYETPYDALRDKTQSILTQIVAHLEYSSMVKQRSMAPEMQDEKERDDPSSQFLDSLRTRAMDDLHTAALEYGIVLKDLAVIDRQFKGDIAATMEKLTTRALQAQVEAANVDRENSNKVKQEEGALSVARIKAMSRNTQADAEAYSVIAAAKAEAERTRIAAASQADAIKLAAEAQAEAVRIKARADAEVTDTFAREMEMRRVEVQRVEAFGERAVFVPTDGIGASAGGSMLTGLAVGMGANAGKR
ncbi:band 7 domain-containing protein [Peniophora sp. CONT]|nr:band 7 domain-containing protein [Peniophora sp. CONT]